MKIVQHEENMKSERNSETWTECNTEQVQHEESATREKSARRGKCKMEKVKQEKSATRKMSYMNKVSWQSKIWKKVQKKSAL